MDPITHAALGAACSQVFFGKYNKSIPWQVGALAALAPDLDVFLSWNNNPLSYEHWHRYFTHSFLFIPFGAILVTLFCLCFSGYRRHWKITLGAAFIGYSTHGLLDALTTYGTVLLWPWNDERISWDIIAIVDIFFTFPLVLGTAWSVIHQDRKGLIFAFISAGAVLFYGGFQHHRALQSIKTFAHQQKIQLATIRAIPVLGNHTQWRVLAKHNYCLIIAQISTPVFKKSSILYLRRVPLFSNKNTPINLSLTQQNDLALFTWFTDQYLIVARQKPLILADARFTAGKRFLYSAWGIEFLPHKAHVNKLSPILLRETCE